MTWDRESGFTIAWPSRGGMHTAGLRSERVPPRSSSRDTLASFGLVTLTLHFLFIQIFTHSLKYFSSVPYGP